MDILIAGSRPTNRIEDVTSVIGGWMADRKKIIEQAYSAFNKRDIDAALALMTKDVS